jgi:HAE1 family hydrophobic/amphiphilic exporter-1
MYKFAINRPITVLMMVLTLVIFGLMSYKKMPVNLFPNIDFPVVTVQTIYAGADPLTVESKVTDLIEEAVSGIDGIDKITSSSVEGMSVVIIQFDLERDITEATNDVRDKIGAINLPDGVETPAVKKVDTGGSVINLFVSSKKGDAKELMMLADEKLKPQLQRIKGVGDVNIIGFRDREIRIFVNPNQLNKYGISIAQLQGVIANENVRLSAGKLISNTQEIIVKSRGDATTIEELRNLIVKEGVRLREIARVEDGLSDMKSYSSINGEEGVMMEVKKISGENALDIIAQVRTIMPNLEKIAGKEYNLKLIQDSSEKILVNLNQVKFDLIYGAILAVMIVFIFLRSLQATILSAIAIPISIIGTFWVMDVMGYDLNKLTLIGLTLAIGIFIDDAIVVIENIIKKLENGMSRLEATTEGIKEIVFSIFGISAMLLAVFVPIAFMDGIVGKFFNSFAMTVASGVIISFFVAILVIPAVGARIVSNQHGRFYYATEAIFVAIERFYGKILSILVRHKFLTIVGVVIGMVVLLPIGKNVGMDFVPMEDNSEYQVVIKAPVGTSVEEMKRKIKPFVEVIKNDENTVDYVASIGYTDSKESHKAKIYVKLKPVEQREMGQAAIVEKIRNSFSDAKGLLVLVEEVPPFATGEANAPIQIVITGDTLEGLDKASKKVMEYMKSVDGVVDIDRDFETGKPEIKISILRENAKAQGVSSNDIALSLNAAFSSEIKISNFEDKGREYDITLRFEDKYRKSIEDIKKMMVTNNQGQLIPLESLVRIEEGSSVASVNRYDRMRKVLVTALKREDKPLDAIVKELDANLPKLLPADYEYRFTGEIERMAETGAAFGAALGLAIILIYLVLASLYESIIQPIIIMISMPLSFTGVTVALGLAGMNYSLFVMIGIILLMGMVGKNGVLVVDFANEAVKNGKSVQDAIVEAGQKRLRPILMTTFAMIGAMIPLAFGTGAGHEGNAPMALAIIGGLVSSTFLTLIVIPAIYRIFYPMDRWLRKYYEKEFL